jgi:hypothetical protein
MNDHKRRVSTVPVRPSEDRCRAAARGRRQDNLRPPDVLLRAVAIGYDRLQPFAIPRAEPDFDISLHTRTVTQSPALWNLLYRSYH